MALLKSFLFHVYTPLFSFLFPFIYWRIKTEKPCLYLTFDDGPNPLTTPYILETLRLQGVKATFFVIGYHAIRYKKELFSIQKEGHLIGNHTFTHSNGWYTSTDKYVKEVEQTEAILEELLGNRPLFFRPPFGKMTLRQMVRIKKTHRIVAWSMLTQDYDSSLAVERCLQETIKGIKPGAIFVFHDTEQAFDKLKIVLPALIKEAHAQGYHFALLP